MQTSFYPLDFVLRGASRLLEAANIDEGTVNYLEESLQGKQVGYRDLIAVRAPDRDEVTFFRLPDDGRVPAVVILRTGFAERSAGLVAFRLTDRVFPADR